MEKLRYIDCCQHYEKDIIGRFEKAKEVKNFFTQEEIDDLRLYQFQNAHRCKFQTTSSNIQPIVDITDISNQKVKFSTNQNSSSAKLLANSGFTRTGATFVRLGDT